MSGPGSFAKTVAEWLDKTPEGQATDPDRAAAALLQDAAIFAKEIFIKQKVGEVTELATLARLDVHFDKFSKWLGVGFLCSTKPTAIRAGLLILTQPILHVGQRVVKTEDAAKAFVGSELSLKGDAHCRAMQDIHSSVQFVALAEKMANSVKTAGGLGANVLERALSILKVSRTRFDAAASEIIEAGAQAGTKLMSELKALKETETMNKLKAICTEGDFTEERIKGIKELTKTEDAVKYYKTFKKSQKTSTSLENIRKASNDIKDAMDIQTAAAKLDTCIGTFTDEEYSKCHDMMGMLLCSQTIWRDLQPGESRDVLAEQCLKHVEELSIPAPLAIALKQLTKDKESTVPIAASGDGASV